MHGWTQLLLNGQYSSRDDSLKTLYIRQIIAAPLSYLKSKNRRKQKSTNKIFVYSIEQ